MSRMIRRIAALGLFGIAGLGFVSNSAQAGYGHEPHCEFKKVVTYVTKVVPVTKQVTVYDNYGYARVLDKTFHKTIQVPVVKWVKVCY